MFNLFGFRLISCFCVDRFLFRFGGRFLRPQRACPAGERELGMNVVFRSAKARTFAERKTTLFVERMKITGIQTHVCHARMRNWVFVKVLTDQPGLFGWGEATLEWHTRAVVGAVEDLAELVVGEDPRRIEHLWQMMYRQHFWHGHGVVRSTAISGIDLALWDIAGKIAGMPCCQLWGGPVRDWIRTYCHLGGGRMEDFTEPASPMPGGSATWRSRRSRTGSRR
jgi:hypothetical protein